MPGTHLLFNRPVPRPQDGGGDHDGAEREQISSTTSLRDVLPASGGGGERPPSAPPILPTEAAGAPPGTHYGAATQPQRPGDLPEKTARRPMTISAIVAGHLQGREAYQHAG